jgi:hypothetical protein
MTTTLYFKDEKELRFWFARRAIRRGTQVHWRGRPATIAQVFFRPPYLYLQCDGETHWHGANVADVFAGAPNLHIGVEPPPPQPRGPRPRVKKVTLSELG